MWSWTVQFFLNIYDLPLYAWAGWSDVERDIVHLNGETIFQLAQYNFTIIYYLAGFKTIYAFSIA